MNKSIIPKKWLNVTQLMRVRCTINIERCVSEPRIIAAVRLCKALEADKDEIAEVFRDIDVHILM